MSYIFVIKCRSSRLPQQKPDSWDQCWWEGNRITQMLATWEDGRLSSQRPSPHLSVGRGFCKDEEGNQGRGLRILWWGEYMQANTVCSDNWLKVMRSPGTGMSECWSLYLLKLVLRSLKPTCYLSTSCILVRVSIYTMSKQSWGGLQFPTLIYSHSFILWFPKRGTYI